MGRTCRHTRTTSRSIPPTRPSASVRSPLRFLITGEHATGSVALFELTVPAAQRLAAAAHSHDHYEETIYGIEGVLTWTVDGKPIDVGPGQALCIPRGAVHRFDNNGAQDVKALCAITPAAIGPQYFREAAAVIVAAAGGPARPSQDGRDHAPARTDSRAMTHEGRSVN